MVQPNEVIEPQPRKMPPRSAVEVFLGVNRFNLNLPPASAAAKEVKTIPITNQPLLVIVSEITAMHPAMRSSPSKSPVPISLSDIKLRAVVLI